MNDAERLKLNWEAEDRITILSVYTELSKTPPGRKFLWHLLQLGKVGFQPFTANALATAFNCGELNVGQRILADILDSDPTAYVVMQKEMTDEHRTRTDRLTGADTTDDEYT